MRTIHKQNLLTAAIAGVLTATITPLAAQDVTNSLEQEPPPYRPWTVGIGIGTDAIFGGGISWRFSDHFGTRVGFGYSQHTWDGTEIGGLEYNAKVRLMCEPLTLNIYPWRKHSFHFSVGVMFNQNEATGDVSNDGIINVDGYPIEIRKGSISAKITQQPVNPYLSIGGNLFYFDRAHRWAFAGELGVAYMGDARVSLGSSSSASIPDGASDKIKSHLQDYADQFQWWPMLKLAVTYSF